MPFPSQKIHRIARRRLGRGQSPTPVPITAQVMGTGTTVTIHFTAPVLKKGPIIFDVPTATAITQTQTTPTTIVITYAGNIWGLDWQLPSGQQNLTSTTGAPIVGNTGTFQQAPPPPTTLLLSAHTNVDQTLSLVFNQNILWVHNGFSVNNLLVWSPADQAWSVTAEVGTGNSPTLIVSTGPATRPISKVVITDQLMNVTAASPFVPATPIAPIT